MFDQRETVDKALLLLAAALEASGRGPYEIVVIGGAALSILGFGIRSTKDIDVLGLRQTSTDASELVVAKHKPLPAPLLEAASQVADALGLDPEWLNAGPADLLDQGLPEGFEQRLTAERYGPRLTVWLPARQDLICFKAYAAADTGIGRHTEDLQALQASCDELLAGALWARSQDPSEAFLEMLVGLLRHFGCDDTAEAIRHG
ncbi:MAG: hypothetical protein JXA57_07990 [Armatimonadetes bacterium]|nr:hypothetical protein [Armatimonadota bacterium]